MQHFDRLQTQDEQLNRIQDKLKAVVNPIANKVILDGQLVTATVTGSATKIAHGIARVPNGWFCVNGLLITATQAPDDKFLYVLNSLGSTVSATFWVF